MRLYRVFPWDGRALDAAPGGPLHVARAYQGSSRHGCPDRYGVLYCSREPVSAVAEAIQKFRGQAIEDADLAREGLALALAELELDDATMLPDLDDPANLVSRGLRPSRLATGRRAVTQQAALALFEEGIAGFGWWSALEASWRNVSLFEDRIAGKIETAAPPVRLTTAHPELERAADAIGVML